MLASGVQKPRLILIGSSTGGPSCLRVLFSHMKFHETDRLIIVQHMPLKMTERFAKRIEASVGRVVRVAQTGDTLEQHTTLVAPGDRHLSFALSSEAVPYCRVSKLSNHHAFRPSIDLAISTTAGLDAFRKFAVILTGMGNDGSAALAEFKSKSGICIAQNPLEASAPGMPSAALETGCIEACLNVKEIAYYLNSRILTSEAA
jgi:two-component system chemotaxis response regulator CheB